MVMEWSPMVLVTVSNFVSIHTTSTNHLLLGSLRLSFDLPGSGGAHSVAFLPGSFDGTIYLLYWLSSAYFGSPLLHTATLSLVARTVLLKVAFHPIDLRGEE
jgi:hypothetical protein